MWGAPLEGLELSPTKPMTEGEIIALSSYDRSRLIMKAKEEIQEE